MNLEIGMEVEQVSLGDERLDERCRILLETLAADPQASASSNLDLWVEFLEFCARVFDRELPVDTALFGVGFLGPGLNF